VFRVDHCGGYRYFSGTEQITLTEEEFAEMDWWVRLLLEAEDRVTHNRDVGIAHYEMSFHSESIQFAPMVSRSKQPVDALIQREQIETALRQMTKRQREVALNYYIYGYSVQEIGDRYGISHQAVSVTLSAVRKKLKRFF
jgi:RNA polymerase sigma factor (sigma-70 family)